MSLQERIAPVSDRLTPTERRISTTLLEDPTLLAFATVSDLAERVGTSRPSIVRFATKLGFMGFSDLQNWIRDDLAQQLSRPSQRIRQHDRTATNARATIETGVRQTLDTLDDDLLQTLAAPLAKAANIWILSGETSMAGAIVLHSGLSMARPGVHLVQEHSAGRELSSAEASDVAVVFDFARYRRSSVTNARALHALGVPIMSITDGPLSPLAALSEHWCRLHIPAVGPFDSSIPAVLTAELLVARTVKLLGKPAHARIDRLESLWQSTGTFLEYTPRDQRGP